MWVKKFIKMCVNVFKMLKKLLEIENQMSPKFRTHRQYYIIKNIFNGTCGL